MTSKMFLLRLFPPLISPNIILSMQSEQIHISTSKQLFFAVLAYLALTNSVAPGIQ